MFLLITSVTRFLRREYNTTRSFSYLVHLLRFILNNWHSFFSLLILSFFLSFFLSFSPQNKCIAVPVIGKFKRGSYRCQCKPGYYFPTLNASHNYFNGTLVENQLLERLRNGSTQADHFSDSFQCLPCRKGCPNCVNDQPCFVEYNILLRGIPLGIQSFCMTITILLALVIFRLRKSKVSYRGSIDSSWS